jgi:hypothetical protein
MVRHIVDEVEQLHLMGALRRNEPRAALVAETLARCLRELRAIVALKARGDRPRPELRIV